MTPLVIEPGSPWKNGYVESFPDILRVLESPPVKPLQDVRDLRSAWAGACYELAEALGWPETAYKPGHSVLPGQIPWRRWTGGASIPDLQRTLVVLHARAQNIPPPKVHDGG